MKIIFLDIDGVLNCTQTPNPRKFPYVIDARLLRRLKRLLKQSKAKAVLSSSWRVDPIGLLAAKHFGVPFIDVCPDMPSERRCVEMRAWLIESNVAPFRTVSGTGRASLGNRQNAIYPGNLHPTCAAPTSSAMRAPRAPMGFSPSSVVSRAV
jgi:HAD domain in Swiss Army Knife RNA repair proteins